MLQNDSCRMAQGKQFKLSRERKKNISWSLNFAYDDDVFHYEVETDGVTVLKEHLLRYTAKDQELMFLRKKLEVTFGDAYKNDPWYGAR